MNKRVFASAMLLAGLMAASLGFGACDTAPVDEPAPAELQLQPEEPKEPGPAPGTILVTPQSDTQASPRAPAQPAAPGTTNQVGPDPQPAPAVSVPQITGLEQSNVVFGDGTVITGFNTSAIVSVSYAGDCDVEILEFDFDEDPSSAQPFRVATIEQAFNFDLDDFDKAGFQFYVVNKASGIDWVAPQTSPVQHRVRYLPREVCDGVAGPFGPSSVLEVRYTPVDNPDAERVRPADGAMG